jgi:excisionase family DNA binding protein
MAERRESDQLELLKKLFKPTREERTAQMDDEILSVEGAAKALGVSTRTIYNLARSGDIPAMRVGREWRFSLKNIREWVANGSQADQLKTALRNGRIARKR